jgi:hypothetical protein
VTSWEDDFAERLHQSGGIRRCTRLAAAQETSRVG